MPFLEFQLLFILNFRSFDWFGLIRWLARRLSYSSSVIAFDVVQPAPFPAILSSHIRLGLTRFLNSSVQTHHYHSWRLLTSPATLQRNRAAKLCVEDRFRCHLKSHQCIHMEGTGSRREWCLIKHQLSDFFLSFITYLFFQVFILSHFSFLFQLQ